MNDGACDALYVRDDGVGELAVIRGLAAAFRVKRRVSEHDFKAFVAFGAGDDLRGEFPGVRVAVKEFVQIGHDIPSF